MPSIPAVCAALADETRWAILARLGTAPASASALAAEMPVSRQAIAKHLAVLRDTGLVAAERVGREVRFAAVGSELSRVGRAIESVATGWDRRLARLKAQAQKDDSGTTRP
ncbi:metalloregulator ArsR/SmtB family transcription factor [Georgenia ruanii]|uniref:Metalloregulator ArsR/SmtB family transcription factor n=1 Tax=Georgenia ruanii TaxID=348442 RepID=A0A7J9UX03_9MICO|nr:metalloregulator ArsR/SmtB family transcription factor [Georgenia ruanii]